MDGKTTEVPSKAAYDEVVWSVTAGLLWERLGRELTAEEKESFSEAFPWTSVFDCVNGCLESLGLFNESDQAE